MDREMLAEAIVGVPPTAVWPSRNRTIHDLFTEQAVARPDSVALVLPDSQLTYEQLNRRANQLAHLLIAQGVQRGALVGLCLERSAETIVALLGILKAGAAYVPLDPAYPDDRLAFMISDTAAPCVLTHEATRNRLERLSVRTKFIDLHERSGELAAHADSQPAVASRAEDRAYVIYTSGSTGSPKGVLVSHRAVVRLVRDTDYCQFGPDEVFIHLAPLAFDASTFEIWGPLLNGGRLVVLPAFPLTPNAIASAVTRFRVSTLWLTSGLFGLVADQRVDAFKHLHQLVAGGDVLSPPHVARAAASMDRGVLINGYGPTENTTFSTCFTIRPGQACPGSIPIGRPIANTTAFVLDEQRQIVTDGAAGELYVGGDGLADGYLNNAELTREKFVANPFGSGRLYRTGDRVRILPDSNFEFLGRLDNQLKIMGHRIEPGEIEVVLKQHPAVRQAVVVARKLSRGDKQLAAYVIPAQADQFTATELKRFLQERLPAHLIPSRFLSVSEFPLNPNGKVDRAQLAERPDTAASPAPIAISATDLERTIATTWSQILGSPVGLDENFFDAGGTSLLLLEIAAELSRRLGQALDATELFEHTTVRSLATRLAGISDSVPLTGVQERGRLQRAAFGRQRPTKGTRS
jgi:amino acid adenylation domain-containing protein